MLWENRYTRMFEFTDWFDETVSKQNGAKPLRFSLKETESSTVIFTQNGKAAQMSAVKTDSVLSVQRSKNQYNNKTDVTICSKKASGIVQKITKDAIFINDIEYPFSAYYKAVKKARPNLMQNFSAGKKATVLLNAAGQVCALDKGKPSGAGEYVYVIGAKSAFSQNLISYADSNGILKTAPLLEELSGGQSAAEVVSQIKAQKNAPALIETDKQGNVKAITLKEMMNTGFVISQNGTITGHPTLGNDAFRGKKVILESDTPILGVGFLLDGSVDTSYFQKLPMSSLDMGGFNVSFSEGLINLVDYDPENATAGMVVVDNLPKTKYENYVVPIEKQYTRLRETTPSSFTDTVSNNLFLVNEVSVALSEDDEQTFEITGIHAGEEKSYVLSPDVLYMTSLTQWAPMATDQSAVAQFSPQRLVGGQEMIADRETGEARSVSDFFPKRFQMNSKTGGRNTVNDYTMPEPKAGDIAAVTLDVNGEVSEYVYFANANEYPEQAYCERPVRAYMQWGYTYSPVTSIENGTLTVCEKTPDGAYLEAPTLSGYGPNFETAGINAYLWDFEEERFVKISADEMYASYEKLSDSAFSPKQKGLLDMDNNAWCLSTPATGRRMNMCLLIFRQKQS